MYYFTVSQESALRGIFLRRFDLYQQEDDRKILRMLEFKSSKPVISVCFDQEQMNEEQEAAQDEESFLNNKFIGILTGDAAGSDLMLQKLSGLGKNITTIEGVDVARKSKQLVRVKAGRRIGRLEVQEDSLVVGGRHIVGVSDAVGANVTELDLEQELSFGIYGKISESGLRYLMAQKDGEVVEQTKLSGCKDVLGKLLGYVPEQAIFLNDMGKLKYLIAIG